jgi:hypothetical protein
LGLWGTAVTAHFLRARIDAIAVGACPLKFDMTDFFSRHVFPFSKDNNNMFFLSKTLYQNTNPIHFSSVQTWGIEKYSCSTNLKQILACSEIKISS